MDADAKPKFRYLRLSAFISGFFFFSVNGYFLGVLGGSFSFQWTLPFAWKPTGKKLDPAATICLA